MALSRRRSIVFESDQFSFLILSSRLFVGSFRRHLVEVLSSHVHAVSSSLDSIPSVSSLVVNLFCVKYILSLHSCGLVNVCRHRLVKVFLSICRDTSLSLLLVSMCKSLSC